MAGVAVRWHVYPDAEALYEAAARVIDACAREAIKARGAFHVVLCGGETPRPVYARLRASTQAWEDWHVYFGDERCLPAADRGRNDFVAGVLWLDHVAIPAVQVHSIPAEYGALEGARRYAAALAGVPEFDLVLLGIGEDGHTASLFPGHEAGEQAGAPDVLAVTGAPKPPPERVSLSARRLARCRQGLVLAQGAGKAGALARWRAGQDLPIARVRPAHGLDVLADLEAVPFAQTSGANGQRPAGG